jgi:hypothetical protein
MYNMSLIARKYWQNYIRRVLPTSTVNNKDPEVVFSSHHQDASFIFSLCISYFNDMSFCSTLKQIIMHKFFIFKECAFFAICGHMDRGWHSVQELNRLGLPLGTTHKVMHYCRLVFPPTLLRYNATASEHVLVHFTCPSR